MEYAVHSSSANSLGTAVQGMFRLHAGLDKPWESLYLAVHGEVWQQLDDPDSLTLFTGTRLDLDRYMS